MLLILAVLMEKDVSIDEFDKERHGDWMRTTEDLSNLLKDRATYDNYDDLVIRKLKEFVSKYTPGDFPQKGPSKIFFQYISDLYRKLNVRNTM
jgi:hypothetical protein